MLKRTAALLLAFAAALLAALPLPGPVAAQDPTTLVLNGRDLEVALGVAVTLQKPPDAGSDRPTTASASEVQIWNGAGWENLPANPVSFSSSTPEVGKVEFYRLKAATGKCEVANEKFKTSPHTEGCEPYSRVQWGVGEPNVRPPLDTPYELLRATPGGNWTTQMAVSVLCSVMTLLIFRSAGAAAVMGAAAVLPISAFGMSVLGFGNLWYAGMTVVIAIATLFAFKLLSKPTY